MRFSGLLHARVFFIFIAGDQTTTRRALYLCLLSVRARVPRAARVPFCIAAAGVPCRRCHIFRAFKRRVRVRDTHTPNSTRSGILLPFLYSRSLSLHEFTAHLRINALYVRSFVLLCAAVCRFVRAAALQMQHMATQWSPDIRFILAASALPRYSQPAAHNATTPTGVAND